MVMKHFFLLLYAEMDLCSLMVLAGSQCLRKITGDKPDLPLMPLQEHGKTITPSPKIPLI